MKPMRPSLSRARWSPAVLALLACAVVVAAAAPRARIARRTADIPAILSGGPHVGDCARCHSQHGVGGVAYERALIGPDDNTLCDRCHADPWAGGSYAGTAPYAGSSHGSEQAAIWPGPLPPPRREAGAAGKCLNCHDPHGWPDATGIIPLLGLAREEALCLTCHDGSPAARDVRLDQLKPFRHPTQDHSGRHAGPLESVPTDFGQAGVSRRHAECQDCHNPHLARADRVPPGPDRLSATLIGVSRVAVANGAPGSIPAYTFLPGSDTLSAPGGDWQLCFKCHSSWTSQPGGQTDLARVLNPNNPSYHPVQSAGRNPAISPQAFVAGWSAGSRTPCGSCHGSDNPQARGPHGSLNRYILKRPYDPSTLERAMSRDELCFSCHDWDVYANRDAPPWVRSASRFNRPGADKGHAEHVGDKQVPCGACHATHGSTSLPHLLHTGPSPGLISVTLTPSGGTCSPTCHSPESYTVNYGR